MRVQSESPSGIQRTMSLEGAWPPSPTTNFVGRENLWAAHDEDLPIVLPEDYHSALEDLHPHFSLQVDPSLHVDLDPSLEPPFGINPARSIKSRGGSSGLKRTRASLDLLSPNAAALFRAATAPDRSEDLNPASPSSPSSLNSIPRLPPILQVEKKTVTTTATQAASASRRRNEANYQCPVPGCGSTFTRRFNLRGHLRSHTEERPFVCEWPGCNKGFARMHDCKRHYALHVPRQVHTHLCGGCAKSFSRTDALNRHLRSDNAAECREKMKLPPLNTNSTTASPQLDEASTEMEGKHLRPQSSALPKRETSGPPSRSNSPE